MTFTITETIFNDEANALAQGIFDEVRELYPSDSADALRETMLDQAHEVADGHQWTIYHYKALQICTECNTDQGEDMLADCGMPENPTLESIASTIVYHELQGRIASALEALIDSADEDEDEDEDATFSHSVHAHDFGTVAHWRDYRTKVGAYKSRAWKGAMAKFAKLHGQAVAMLADDGALVMTRDDSVKAGYRTRTIPAAKVTWQY